MVFLRYVTRKKQLQLSYSSCIRMQSDRKKHLLELSWRKRPSYGRGQLLRCACRLWSGTDMTSLNKFWGSGRAHT